MPHFQLKMKATFEGARKISADEHFGFRIRLSCCNCGHLFPKVSVFGFDDAQEVPGGTGTAHLVQKCPECNGVGSLEITSLPNELVVSAEEDGDAEAVIASFECRGFKPAEFVVVDGYNVTGVSGQVFDSVELGCAVGPHSDGFSEFDEDANLPVTISNIICTFEQTKGRKK